MTTRWRKKKHQKYQKSLFTIIHEANPKYIIEAFILEEDGLVEHMGLMEFETMISWISTGTLEISRESLSKPL